MTKETKQTEEECPIEALRKSRKERFRIPLDDLIGGAIIGNFAALTLPLLMPELKENGYLLNAGIFSAVSAATGVIYHNYISPFRELYRKRIS